MLLSMASNKMVGDEHEGSMLRPHSNVDLASRALLMLLCPLLSAAQGTVLMVMRGRDGVSYPNGTRILGHNVWLFRADSCEYLLILVSSSKTVFALLVCCVFTRSVRRQLLHAAILGLYALVYWFRCLTKSIGFGRELYLSLDTPGRTLRNYQYR